MGASDWFSASYAEGREKFLAAAAAAGAGVTSFKNSERGPDGGALFTDVAWAGPEDAASVLLTCSGTHGVEGFCGSGAQVATFRSGLARDLPKGTMLVAVHAINPYGFAWVRRVNEDNVDLNRNFVDHAAGHPANAPYDEVHPLLVPADWDGAAKAAADRGIQNYIQSRGLAAFQAALSGGQYDHPDGIFYGGREPTWSNRTLHQVLDRFLRGRRRVAFIDYHTGLGPSGFGEIICTHKPGTPGYHRAKEWFGDVTSPDDGSSASAPIQGFISSAFERELKDCELTAIAIEYGTQPVPEVLEAVRADNWLHLHSDPASELGRKVKAQVRRAFYTETDLWKEQIWARANEVSRKCLTLLGRP